MSIIKGLFARKLQIQMKMYSCNLKDNSDLPNVTYKTMRLTSCLNFGFDDKKLLRFVQSSRVQSINLNHNGRKNRPTSTVKLKNMSQLSKYYIIFFKIKPIYIFLFYNAKIYVDVRFYAQFPCH